MGVVYRPNHPLANENGMVDLAIAGPKHPTLGQAPNVIRDDLGTHLRHMGTGKMLDSKSAFRKEDKACGGTCIGNEQVKPRRTIEMPRAGPDIKRAIEQLRNR
jgi:hypothetical protein